LNDSSLYITVINAHSVTALMLLVASILGRVRMWFRDTGIDSQNHVYCARPLFISCLILSLQ